MKFGRYLIDHSLITATQLEDALTAQKYIPEKLGRILVELGSLDQLELNMYLEKYLTNYAKVLINKEVIQNSLSPVKIDNIDREEFLKNNLLPLKTNANEPILMTSEIDDKKLQELENFLPLDYKLVLVTKELFNYAKAIQSKKKVKKELTDKKASSTNKKELSNPYNKIYKELIENAKKEKISDIHIIPHKNGLRIKLRKYGTLNLWKELSIDHRDSFIAHCKHLLNLNVAIVGVPQDSRTSVDYLNLDLRINSTPMIYGNKIVIRLLDRDKEFNIDNSGIAHNVICKLKEVCHKKSGLILISGQTGSGKTTTLYSLLSYLNKGYTNISTIEDPVEYTLDGLDQIDITSKKDLTFSNSLRALMRQDPDVILVGEVRDEETANLCLKASSSGHLVFTTIHAGTPIGAINKFVDFGADRNSIAENLLLSMNQCLVPIICKYCSEIKSTKDDYKYLYKQGVKQYRVANGQGCPKCFKGNTELKPINEILDATSIENYINGKEVAFKTKKEAALELLSEELITPESYLQF